MSLTETVISMMLLVSAFFVVIRLFHTGLRYLSQADQQSVAVLIAERTLEEIRGWAKAPASFDDWTPYTNLDRAVSDFPGYRVEVRSQAVTLKSPASGFENQEAAADQRLLTASTRKVQVTVFWAGDRKRLRVVTLVTDPVRNWRNLAPIEVAPTVPPPDPLGHGAPVTFTAKGFDSAGKEIQDLCFAWYIKPSPGNGTLTQSRDGRTATFTNVVIVPNRPPLYTGKSVVVEARAIYRGQERTGESQPVNLLP